jgi:plasmid stabilization system protein ParE
MRVVYLQSTARGLVWFQKYYTTIFPEGGRLAREQLKQAELNLVDNPMIGRSINEQSLRLVRLARTPFSLVYRVAADRIEIIDVIDHRSDLDVANK